MTQTDPAQYENAAYQPDQEGRPDPASAEAPAATQHATSAGKFPHRERYRVLKNVITISFAFTFLFTAFNGTSNLQSSINSGGGLGTIGLATIYAALLCSCMFLPSLVIKRLSCKWTMVACTLCYSTYMLAQLYPRTYTIVPGAIVLGLGAAPMWSAKCTYFTQVGQIYAEMTESPTEPVIVKFFGIFFLFFQSAQIWGNLISSLVLSPPEGDEIVPSSDSLSICGINYCPGIESGSNNTNLVRPPSHQINLLMGVFLAMAVVSSIIVAIFVDSLSRYGENERGNNAEGTSPLTLLVATFTHMKKPYQLLIIPLTIWSGFEQAFLTADYSKAFVSCAWGIHKVGLVLIAYGITDSICSISFGFVIKKIGRVPIFLMGALVNYIVIGAYMNWSPSPDYPYTFFLLAAGWGVSDAVWQTQINALYGVLFPDTSEAAFSNYRLWESLGYAVAFIYADLLCVRAKVALLLVVLTLGMLGYLVIELLERRKQRGQLSVTESQKQS